MASWRSLGKARCLRAAIGRAVALSPRVWSLGAQVLQRAVLSSRLVMRSVPAWFAGAMFSTGAAAQAIMPEHASSWSAKEVVSAQRHLVVAAHPRAVAAGMAMLEAGGSAVDAAIAVQMVLNLVEPQSSGLGGGAFLLYHAARTRRLEAYDGRETAPAAARPERFLDAAGKPLAFFDAVVGGRAVGVPGLLAMLELAHRRHGRLPWARLFEPAIALAETGFPISPRLAAAIAKDAHLGREPSTRAYFFHSDGRPRTAGEELRNPAFAAVLRLLAEQGADGFYQGEIARDIVAAVRGHERHPGDLTAADLADYRPKLREPVCGHYRSYRVCGMPPPSSGGIAVLQMLGILEHFPMASVAPNSLFAVHLFSEAGRLAYADRNRYLADPDFVSIPAGLTDRSYLAERARLVQLNTSLGRAEAGWPSGVARLSWGEDALSERPATSHLSIVDRWGNALAMTSTIESGFGARLMVRGFLLNNQLTDFSFSPREKGALVANRVEPGKRPRSSMAPTIVYDRKARIKMITGSPGGSAIINYVAQNLIAVLDWRLDPQAAADLPHVGSRNGPTEIEQGTAAPALLAEKLKALGHELRLSEFNSGVHSIVREGRNWLGGADPRREGSAQGE